MRIYERETEFLGCHHNRNKTNSKENKCHYKFQKRCHNKYLREIIRRSIRKNEGFIYASNMAIAAV